MVGLPLQCNLLIGVRKLYLYNEIGEFYVIIVMKSEMSRVISCRRGDSVIFVFMVEFKVLVQFLFI